ncbi:hypothetical protein UPYG_G00277690 [Umbra pygmaea]|uniref:Senataxin n=1 Tax=Umbra pygmaea TaxID=75934 RepID=A0ABD0W6X8_UMBPY
MYNNMMSTCRWCIPERNDVAELLQMYCSGSLSAEDEEAVNDDLNLCPDCVDTYHSIKEESPELHRDRVKHRLVRQRLWELETSRLLKHFSHAAEEALPAQDISYIEEDGREVGVPQISPAEYEDHLRVALSEILQYPYLLAHPKLSEMFVEAICKIEEWGNSFMALAKYPGIYLLLVHPNETVRRWAIGAARSLGKVDRDDFYDLQDIFSCMFYVVKLGIPQNFTDTDTSYDPMTKMTLLPPHLFEPNNPKNYWLGICMLLTQLDAQAMDSLFLGPDKETNILNCILNALEGSMEDEDTPREMDPFWPVLDCFMVILDCLGSKIWGHIEPSQVLQFITERPSYIAEIESIRKQTMISQIKTESTYDDDDDNMVTCSQMVYESKANMSKDKRRKTSHVTDSDVVYEDMSSLVKLLQSDMGQAMRVHGSTFLWFIPYLKSVMDLDKLSYIYFSAIFRYLRGEISTDLLNRNISISDKVSEFFALILVYIIDIHMESDCIKVLCYSSHTWVDVLVKCAILPTEAFVHASEFSASHSVSSTSSKFGVSRNVSISRAVPQACMKTIRSLLREGSRSNPNSKCSHFLNILNKQLREGPQKEWKLNRSEVRELYNCLKNYVKMMNNLPNTNTPPHELPTAPSIPPLRSSDDPGPSSRGQLKPTLKQEVLCGFDEGSTSGSREMKEEEEDEFVKPTNDSRPTHAAGSVKAEMLKMKLIQSRLGPLINKKSKSKQDDPGAVGAKDKPQSLLRSSRDEAEIPTTSKYPCIRDVDEESDSDELDNVPLSVLKSKLTGIEDLHSSQDLSKGHIGHIDQSPRHSPSDVIFISDDDSSTLDDDDNDDYEERQILYNSESSKIKHEPEPLDASDQNHSPWQKYDEDMSKSQVFEFETPEDMVSAWPEQVSECKSPPERLQKYHPVRHTVSRESTAPEVLDTQPVSEEAIKRDCQQVERFEMNKTPHIRLKQTIVVTNNSLVDAKPLRSKCLSKKSLLGEKQDIDLGTDSLQPVTAPLRKSSLRVCLNGEETDMRSSITPSSIPAVAHKTATPAVVPLKVRKPMEPTSTAEKLGLKKKERKAFDLSQRTLGSVDELRRYGASVNVPQSKKHSRKTNRSKRTSPQNRVGTVTNKLLASQEVQYFKQSKQASGAGISAKVQRTRDPITSDENLRPSFVTEKNNEMDEDLPCSQPDLLFQGERKITISSIPKEDKSASLSSTQANSISSSMDSLVSPNFQGTDENITPDQTARTDEKNESGDNDDYDEDWMQLTQMEPTDMEICSDSEDENLFSSQRDPVDMDIDASQVPLQEKGESSVWICPSKKLETPIVPQSFKKPASLPPSVNGLDQEDDQLFIKSGMSPISLKKAKPSTTKMFGTSKSRNDSLMQDMEKTANAKGSAAPTPFGRGRPARSAVQPPQPVFRQPFPPKQHLYKPIAPQQPPPKPIPPPQQPPPRPQRNLSSPPSQPFRPIQHSNVGSTPQPSTCKIYPRPDAPVQRQMTNQNDGSRFEPNYLIQHILNWTFDMFSNYRQFGIPSEICELPLKPIGLSFKTYDEYYDTFYPLLLTNTFEELVGDWLKNKESENVVSHNFKAQANEYSRGVWNVHLETSLTATDESLQRYPKEDDLVILGLAESSYSRQEHSFLELEDYFGYVLSSNVFNKTGQPPLLDIKIKTRGDVASVNKQAVRCDVVGSLVSTLREFKALCMLRNSPMLKPLLEPDISYFQPGLEDIPNFSLPGYNPDQMKAVRTSMSFITNPKRTPKICLIHGPPGTGKSKTILGLLLKQFPEVVPTSDAPANRQAKGSHNRVLVCTPSNSSLDNLMKKVITVFKEKCKTIQGNCGNINIVRLGNDRTISQKLKIFSLNNQVKNRTQKDLMTKDTMFSRRKGQLDKDIDEISKSLPKLQKTEERYKNMTEQKTRLLKDREALSADLKQCRNRKQDTQARVLQEAHVVFCTLSTSGSSVLDMAYRRLGQKPFCCVIVDEAGQATETETLIPLRYRCSSLILVGDPDQLPPTVISQKAREFNYGQSLIARLMTNIRNSCRENRTPSPVIFLSHQYRMHPDICEFPSKHIYNKALKTDNETGERRVNFGWPFQPYQVFDVTDGQEFKERDSFSNLKEVQLVLILLKLIAETRQVRVGVITPYNAQKDRINREIAKMNRRNLEVDVDTVDGFQGREMDCIIVSCVRASHEQGNIGFLGNRQRMNVTITRAKYSLFILGHFRTLRENPEWGALIKDAAKRDTIISTMATTFEMDAKKIFKPELTRSLSYPPRDPAPTVAPWPTADAYRAAPVKRRHPTYPAPYSHRDSRQQWQPSSTSPPQDTDRPTDPRLGAQPAMAPQNRTDGDPLAEVRRDRRTDGHRDQWQEHLRDARGWSDPNQHQPPGYEKQRCPGRNRNRDRYHTPYLEDKVERPPRDPRMMDHYSAQAHKQDSDPRWQHPSEPKRSK